MWSRKLDVPLPQSDCNVTTAQATPVYEWIPFLNYVSRILAAGERFVGQRLVGLLVGLVLLLMAVVYVTPLLQELRSPDPTPHRILAPLIGRYLWPSGCRFVFFPLVASVIFSGAIYSYFRRLGHAHVLAVGAAATMAFSSPVLFHIHFRGNTDVLTSLLLFWCYVMRKTKVVWTVPLALSCLNHESALFSIPWVIFLRVRYYGGSSLSAKRVARLCGDVCLAALSTVPLFFMDKLFPQLNAAYLPAFDLSRFEAYWHASTRFVGMGTFMAFKSFWFLPLFALYTAERGSRFSLSVLFLLMFAAGLAQFFFSTATTHHMVHTFPIIIYSIELLARKNWGSKLDEGLIALVLLNFLVPQYYVAGNLASPLIPWPVSYIFMMFGVDPWNW